MHYKYPSIGNNRITICEGVSIMHTIKYLIGLPIIELREGSQIAKVRDVVLNFESNSIATIVHNYNRSISHQDIQSYGRDAVVIRDKDVLHKDIQFKDIKTYILSSMLLGKTIISECGVSLGILTDVFFDDQSGELKEYEISESFLTDILYGRKYMPIPAVQIIGNKNIIVPETTVKLLHPYNN